MKLTVPFLSMGYLVVIIFFFLPYAATGATIPQVEILTAGMTRTISIEADSYPEDFSQFLIFALGYGAVEITLKHDMQGNQLVLMGIAISPAGIIPFFKSGKTTVTLTASVATGTKQTPLGMIWLTSFIRTSGDNSPYIYMLTLKLKQVEFKQ